MNKVITRIYNSPTFTEWGMRLIQPLRLLLLTPLVLTKLTVDEQAAWYLFATIAFFGMVVNGKIQATFSNMVSIAYGGRKNLSPINYKGDNKNEELRKLNPNWDGVSKVYNSSMKLLVIVVTVVFAINSLIGYYTLKNVTEGICDRNAYVIWVSFVVMRLGDYTIGLSAAPAIVLRGLNYVSLHNRVRLVFHLLALFLGYVSLMLGGSLIALATVMQLVAVLNAAYNFNLLRGINGGKIWGDFKFKIDRQVLSWSREPLIKGTIYEISILGSFHVATLVLTGCADNGLITGYLLAMTMMRAVQHFSIAPFTSKMPRFSRLMSEGEYGVLLKLYYKSIAISTLLYVFGVSCVIFLGEPLLGVLGTDTELIGRREMVFLAALILYRMINSYASLICSAGNNIIFYKSEFAASLLSCLAAYMMIPEYGFNGLYLALFLPTLLIINIRPYYAVRNQLVEKST